MTRTKVHTPGETTASVDDAAPGAVHALDIKPAIEIPEGYTVDQLAQLVAAQGAAMAALQAELTKMKAQTTDATGADHGVKPLSMAEAVKKAEATVADGAVPMAILTTEGMYVHPLAYSTVEDVEKHNDKVALAKTRKAKAAA